MRKRIVSTILFALLLTVSVFGLFACNWFGSNDAEKKTDSDETMRQAYSLYTTYAESNGLVPATYEEWLASIKGQDGVGIASVKVDDDGNLIVTLTNGEEQNAGNVRGATGVGIASVSVNSNHHLIVSLTNGDVLDLGNVKGEDGTNGDDGKGIASIVKTSTDGNVDTYTITYTDQTTSTFTVTNGINGQQGQDGRGVKDAVIDENGILTVILTDDSEIVIGKVVGNDGVNGAAGKGIVSIAKTSTDGNVDTYTITYTDQTTSTFTVTNGINGQSGEGGGVGVSSARINENGRLIIKLTDNTEIDVGKVVGDDGSSGADGNGIVKIEKTATDGLTDTYTITFTNGNTSTFTVVNGAQGEQGQDGTEGNGIASVVKTGTEGLVDTYTITFTNGNTTTFTVVNGAKGDQGENGRGIASVTKTSNGLIDTYTITYTDGETFDFDVKNGADGATGATGATGAAGATGATGNGIATINKTSSNGLKDTYTITYTNGQTATFTVTNGAQGEQGATGATGATGNGIWTINKKSSVNNVDTYVITFTNGETFEYRVTNGEKGEQGATGATGAQGPQGVGIYTVAKTSTNGLVDTYTITLTNGTKTTFTVTNGAKGEKGDKGDKGDTGATGATGATGNGIVSVAKTGTSGLVDTYTITFTDGSKTTFTVTNGAQGEQGATGATGAAGATGATGADGKGIKSITKTSTSGLNVTYTITFTDNTTTTFVVTNGAKGDKGDKGDTGATGKGISNTTIDSDGHLIITYTDGTTQDAGKVRDSGSSSSTSYYTEGLTYTLLSDGTYEVSLGSADRTIMELIIPDTYNGKAVTSIAEFGFRACKRMESVTIPASVTRIKQGAFETCVKMKAVYFLGTLAQWCDIEFGGDNIGHSYYGHPNYTAHNLFINNRNLTEINIPNTMTELKPYTFVGNDSLKRVTIPASVKTINTGAFADCGNLNQVKFDSASKATIKLYAFFGSMALVHMEIPTGVTLEEGALLGCGIDEAFTYVDTSNDDVQYMVFMLTNTIYQETERFFSKVKNIYGSIDPDSNRMYAIGIVGPFVLNHTVETMRAMVYDCFEMAVKYDIPIYFQMDDHTMYFTYNEDTAYAFEDEENCVHTVGLTTYRHYYQDPEMCEWTSLSKPSSSQLPKWYCSWEGDIETDCHVIGGFPCFNSTSFLTWYDKQVTEGVVNPIKENLIRLKKDAREYLFAGISTGWETEIPDYSNQSTQPLGTNSYANLKSYEKAQYGMHAIYNLGYTTTTKLNNAASAAGLSQRDFIRQCLYQVMHDFIEHTCKLFYDAGIGRGKIFSHTLGKSSATGGDPLGGNNAEQRDTFVVPIWVSINDYCTPGWTMSTTCPYDLGVLYANLHKYTNGYNVFGNVETYCASLGETEAECRRIVQNFMGGNCKVICFFGYEQEGVFSSTLGFPRDKTDYRNVVIRQWLKGIFLPNYTLGGRTSNYYKTISTYDGAATSWSFSDNMFSAITPVQAGAGGVTYSIDFANNTIGAANVPKYVTVFFGPANSAGAAVPWTGAYSTGQFALRFYINYDAGNFRLFVAPLDRAGSGGFYGSYTWSQVDVVNAGGTISCPIVIEPSTSGNKLIVGGVVMNDYLTASGGSAFMGSTYLTNVAFSCDSSTGCDVRLNGVWAIN